MTVARPAVVPVYPLHPSPEAVRRRQDKVVELAMAGYSSAQIAQSMGGMSNSTIQEDKRSMRRFLTGAPRTTKGRPDDPPLFEWWKEPLTEVRPSYQLTGPVTRVEKLNEGLAELNAVNRLAFNVTDAEAAGDTKWILQSKAQVEQAIATLQEMHAVLSDREARAAAQQDGRTDLSAPPGTWKPLPARGTGVVPGRAYAMIWTYLHAGVPMDDEVVRKITWSMKGGSGRKGNEARIRTAIAEMREAYPELF